MLSTCLSWVGRLSPWVIIGGLSYAALFVQPTVNPHPLSQPLLENRDAFFDAEVYGPHIWAVGQNGALLESLDSGDSWSREEVPGRDNLQGIAVSPAGRVVVVGNQGRLWVKQDDGSWKEQQVLAEDTVAKLLDVTFIDNHFWVVGEIGSLLRGDADGSHWQQLSIDEDVTLNSIRAGANGDLWIAAEFGRLLHSVDHGQTWQVQELGSESLRAIQFNAQVGVAVGNRGGLYLSEDAGANWRQVPAFSEEHLYDVIWSDGRWIATGDRGALYQSHQAIPAKGWQRWSPAGLDKSYHSRLLNTEHGVLLIGKQVGLLGAEDLRLLIKENQ
ncbi:YCF48-related protein [Pseudomonas sp. 5P_3.1_Bac2]|uniref:YCF48-related protein n=1 Tax=Pseudomonas sp. 5P_3.1_Bac2 TaxID=2971617 RepID=UPI0021CAA2C1|nr:YCF48-related protein [Pseudomonas sp. 5P_3.1_Bac2]MCU1719046.1 YCF48-related protein [Pseudomonas sp. 5P_3.1_Bac2]